MADSVGERAQLGTFGLLSLRRRWRLIALCSALASIIALVVAVLKPATYTASTQLLVYVRELQPGPEPVVSPGRADLTQVQNEIEIIRSRGLLTKVARSLNLTADTEFVPVRTLLRSLADWLLRTPQTTSEEGTPELMQAAASLERHVAVTRVGTSHTILVSVKTSDAQKSAMIANAIGRIAMQGRVVADQDNTKSPLLRERLQGLGPNAYVMTEADPPSRPDGPRKAFIVLAAPILGLFVGSALALLLDFMNRTIRTAAQVEHLGMECIGIIPRLRRSGWINSSQPASGNESVEEEEFQPDALLNQTLRRATVAIAASKARIVGVTSAVAQEGATTVARYLAQIAARSGQKVLLVNASRSDRSPSLTTGEALPPAGRADGRLRPLIDLKVDERPGLDVLRVDGLDGAAAWRMHCDQARLVAYDLVVVGLPHLELGPECQVATQNLDGILLVLKWGNTELERAERAIALSGVAPSEFIGAVLNMVDERTIGQFGDKLWEAEAALAVRRLQSGFSVCAERAIG